MRGSFVLGEQAPDNAGTGILSWLLNGNTVGSEKWIGTVDNYAFPVRTNNIEKWAFGTSGQIYRGSGSRNLFSIAYSTTNTTWGYNAGAALAGAANVTLIGGSAGINVSTGSTNTLVGYNTGGLLATGTSNTLIGGNAGASLGATATQNTFVGAGAGGNATADKNAFIGYNAGAAQTSGIFNVALGAYAGRNFFSGYSNSAADANIYIGQGAGDGQKSGSYNIFIGLSGGYNFQDGNRNILIGNTVISTSYGAGNITNPWPATNTSDTLGFGNLVQFTASNQIVFGSQTYRYNSAFFGEGAASTAPQSFTYARTNASGTDINGADTYIAVSRSTGTGTSGNIIWQYAASGSTGSSLNSLAVGMLFSGATGDLYLNVIRDYVAGVLIVGSNNTIYGNRITLDSGSGSWGVGDVSLANNKTLLILDDSAQTLIFTGFKGGNGTFASFDINNLFFSIGDISATNNGTFISVDDAARQLIIDSSVHAAAVKINGVAGFSGSGIYTTFTIDGGIVTAAA